MLWRQRTITWFVICWTLLFQYETLRANYLGPLIKRELPKVPLLFPPAGWIMFFNIDRSYGFAEVYGIRRQEPFLIDPHAIFETRAVGYDNIRRNVLVGVLNRTDAPAFCRYLHRKFPQYDAFTVMYALYPDLIDTPNRILRQTVYQCQ
ncbi:MAG: hypothetical protein HYZ91_00690 [Candidatus Omnitrophica bacterium]|nr:hypothetical protein [Candidatus Omnitrophota bacterium]